MTATPSISIEDPWAEIKAPSISIKIPSMGLSLVGAGDSSVPPFYVVSPGAVANVMKPQMGPQMLGSWMNFLLSDESSSQAWSRLQAAVTAREAVIRTTGETVDLPRFGRQFLGLNRSSRWTRALSDALLGNWIKPAERIPGRLDASLDDLRREAREIHLQLVPLWERRTYGNRRVRLLESPVYEGASLRDVLADRSLPEDAVVDQVPGDRRLAAVLQRLTATERAVVITYGQPGVTSWTDAAELAGTEHPAAFGERVRRKVRRTVTELQRRDQHRIYGPTGLWVPLSDGGSR